MVCAEALNRVMRASGFIFARASEKVCCFMVVGLFWMWKNFRSVFWVLDLNLVSMNSATVLKGIFLVCVKLFGFFLVEFLNSFLLSSLFVLCMRSSNSFMFIYVYIDQVCLEISWPQ